MGIQGLGFRVKGLGLRVGDSGLGVRMYTQVGSRLSSYTHHTHRVYSHIHGLSHTLTPHTHTRTLSRMYTTNTLSLSHTQSVTLRGLDDDDAEQILNDFVANEQRRFHGCSGGKLVFSTARVLQCVIGHKCSASNPQLDTHSLSPSLPLSDARTHTRKRRCNVTTKQRPQV